jgi:hypothetical protein
MPLSAMAGDAVLGACQPPMDAAARESGELPDEDLEHVVGGLARVWVDSAHFTPGMHGTAGPHAV